MFESSPQTLKFLAALVWYSGVIALLIKSASLLFRAHVISPGHPWLLMAVLIGVVIGAVKARYLFRRLCLKNLKRIDALEHPKLWHFYRMRFFIFLLTMVILGSYLSHRAQDNFPMLITMAAIELSVAIALLGSCGCFRKEQRIRKR